MLVVISKTDYENFLTALSGASSASGAIPAVRELTPETGFVGIELDGVRLFRTAKINPGEAVLAPDDKIPGWMGGAAGPAQGKISNGLAVLSVQFPPQSFGAYYFRELAERMGQPFPEVQETPAELRASAADAEAIRNAPDGEVIGYADASAAVGDQELGGEPGATSDEAPAGEHTADLSKSPALVEAPTTPSETTTADSSAP